MTAHVGLHLWVIGLHLVMILMYMCAGTCWIDMYGMHQPCCGSCYCCVSYAGCKVQLVSPTLTGATHACSK